MTDAPRWSVVVPAFNEARRLPPHLDEIVTFFEGRGDGYEVIVVDDGSTDDTALAVERAWRAHAPVRLLRLAPNHGKGFAVREGMRAARGRYRLFTDADGATPIAELKRLEPHVCGAADIAIGSRALVAAGVSVVALPHRVAAGRVFNWLVAHLGLPGVFDSQCGFKAFTAAAADDLFPRLSTQGFGFDVELLLLARAAGYRIVEVAVNWAEQPGSKVRVLKDGPKMLWQIVRARRRIGRRP